MIKIFGRQPFFIFTHYIYEYDVLRKSNIPFTIEVIKNNIQETDMGYFSTKMLNRVLKRNKNSSIGFLFKNNIEKSVIGFAIVCFRGAREIHYKIKNCDAFITALGVFPKFRGRGYSQFILMAIENFCFERKLKKIKLAVDFDNYKAIKAYEKFGFNKNNEKHFFRIIGVDFLVNKNV